MSIKNSDYRDNDAALHLIGCILKKPSLLENDGIYFFNEEDFLNDMHKVVFGAVYNLYQTGAQNITLQAIENYLESKPKSKAIYDANGGAQWVENVKEQSELLNFDHYYNTIKKLTLLRAYDAIGVDVSKFYPIPSDILDSSDIVEEKRKYFESLTVDDIANEIEIMIENVRAHYAEENVYEGAVLLGDKVSDILASLEKLPDVGLPLHDQFTNAAVRGARLGKFYIRSAATGIGKSRSMVADACQMACSEIYSTTHGKWIKNGKKQPVLFISTEQDIQEITTMALAFLSAVNEEHILRNEYYSTEELERVQYAAKLLQSSPLYVEELPDFNMKDIENTIKRNLRQHAIQYVFLDYIHSSMKILEEISRRSAGMRLREDNVLFMISVSLKDICTKFNIFIMSATQLNADYQTSDTPDQNLLRGAKAIADKVDAGMILLELTDNDREKLSQLTPSLELSREPNIKMSIYKNRGGECNKCYIWMYADKGTCRFEGIFVTDWKYNPITLTPLTIEVDDNNEL